MYTAPTFIISWEFWNFKFTTYHVESKTILKIPNYVNLHLFTFTTLYTTINTTQHKVSRTKTREVSWQFHVCVHSIISTQRIPRYIHYLCSCSCSTILCRSSGGEGTTRLTKMFVVFSWSCSCSSCSGPC